LNIKNKKSFIERHLYRTDISKTDYRPDLDAMRGIAVLAVVFFHAFPSLIPGGFIGVDIFFVISGYIISKHIIEQLESGTFKIKDFYKRRIKRIFPSLALILLFVILAGWIILTPGEYESLGRPIAGGAAFAANFVFWHEAGYFDSAANTKPLLHLWSLGIEEQFYIFWPFIISLIWLKAKAYFGYILWILTITSIIYSIFLVQNNAVADFYSPLTRSWELSLGAIIAHQTKTFNPSTLQFTNTLPIIGAVLIISSFFIIEESYKFPGAWALLPTIGTGILIYSGASGALFNKTILSSPVLIWIGLISYPLYLWHWPLLTFSRIMNSEIPSVETRLLLLAISFILAWATYKYLELRIRSTSKKKDRYIVAIMISVMVIIFIMGVTIKKMDGFKFRMNSILNGDVSTLTLGENRGKLLETCGLPLDNISNYQFCLSSNIVNEPSIAVLGDSKSEALFYGITKELPDNIGALLIGSVRPPKSNTLIAGKKQTKNQLAFNTVLRQQSIESVVIVTALRSIFKIDTETGFISPDTNKDKIKNWTKRYTNAIKKFEKSGKKVVFVIDNPTLPDPTNCIYGELTSSTLLNIVLTRNKNPKCSIKYSSHVDGTKAYRGFIENLLLLNPKLKVYDPTSILCDIENNSCSTVSKGKFLYSYSDHISDYASSLIANELIHLIGNSAN
jgi:peptidoglycan/LPS O-acetylase OafA/YrhL